MLRLICVNIILHGVLRWTSVLSMVNNPYLHLRIDAGTVTALTSMKQLLNIIVNQFIRDSCLDTIATFFGLQISTDLQWHKFYAVVWKCCALGCIV